MSKCKLFVYEARTKCLATFSSKYAIEESISNIIKLRKRICVTLTLRTNKLDWNIISNLQHLI